MLRFELPETVVPEAVTQKLNPAIAAFQAGC